MLPLEKLLVNDSSYLVIILCIFNDFYKFLGGRLFILQMRKGKRTHYIHVFESHSRTSSLKKPRSEVYRDVCAYSQ